MLWQVNRSCSMVYISPDSKHFYLSKEAMVQLGVISKDFPKVGAAFPYPSACSTSVDPISVTCNCAQQSPGMPDSLPFAACLENVPKMKEWLLKRYASSTFNKCQHKPLLKMAGPSVKFHIKPNPNPIKLNKTSIKWTQGSQICLRSKKIIFGQK